MLDKKSIKSAFESMLYVWGEPLSAKDAAEVVDIDKKAAIEIFEELKDEYEKAGRGIMIRRVNESFQFATREENADFIRRLCTPVKVKKLSQAALEVLAIIAYRQPVTKGEIDQIRGIKCDRVIDGLTAKGLITDKGRSDAVGRPFLYVTTDEFLKNFGFETLDDLPEIEDLEGVMDVDTEEQDPETDDARQMSIDMTGAGNASTENLPEDNSEEDQKPSDSGSDDEGSGDEGTDSVGPENTAEGGGE